MGKRGKAKTKRGSEVGWPEEGRYGDSPLMVVFFGLRHFVEGGLDGWIYS